MKAAGHDLRGLVNYFECHIPGLHVPLMALIDYHGYRLMAVSLLPISWVPIQHQQLNPFEDTKTDFFFHSFILKKTKIQSFTDHLMEASRYGTQIHPFQKRWNKQHLF